MSVEKKKPKAKKTPSKVQAAKPVPVLHKPVKVEIGPLIKALSKGVADLATTQWDKLGNDFVEAALALGLKTRPEELAFLLVHRSLARASIDLVGESINQLPAELGGDAAELTALVTITEGQLAQREFSIDSKFFNRPANLELLPEVGQLLNVWLRAQGMLALKADAIVRRLPAYFVYAVHYELGRNRKIYEPLLHAVETPVATAVERELAWETYASLLQRQSEESIFDEPFSLRQVYIPLNAAYHDDNRDARMLDEPLAHGIISSGRSRKVVDLNTELRKWLKRGDKADAIRVLSGGPGSGKSSFGKIFAAELASEGQRILLIPLHLIDPERDLAEQVGTFARQEGTLGYNPLDPENPDPDLLVIFDGLDELASQGKAGYNTAREFVDAVQRLVTLRNLQKFRLRIIISGRELVVQENESLFQRPGQILDLLPYFVPKDERRLYDDPHKLLASDLRNEWWKNYGRLTGFCYNSLPTELTNTDLDEITAQPLLNYLVALSLTRGKLDFSTDLNLNKIYADLVEAVHERGYEKGRMHAAIQHMTLKEFSRVLEEIALAAWHGDGRSTTVGEIRQHCKESGVGSLLDSFRDGAEKGVTRLLAAFFFRRHGQRTSGDQTFVFTHKSFGEYLTARRIILAVRKFAREFAAREQDADEGRDEREILEQWVRVCGPSVFTNYLVRFLRQEIALQPIELAREWQRVFTHLFNSMLRAGLPLERVHLPTFREALRQNRNAEEALIATLNACALCTKEISRINSPSVTTFGAWLQRIQEQRTGADCCVALKCLSLLSLDSYVLHHRDLGSANLDHSTLRGARAAFSLWPVASLRWADLHGAWLVEANFRGAMLQETNLSESNLTGANLSDAELYKADLRAARLEGANLEGANLSDAELYKADLRVARLVRANLRGANLEGANLEGANLEGANLEGANLEGANLKGTNLEGIDLAGSKNDGTVFDKANTSRVAVNRNLARG